MQYNDEWNKSQGASLPVAGTIDDPSVSFSSWNKEVDRLYGNRHGVPAPAGFNAYALYIAGCSPMETVESIESSF